MAGELGDHDTIPVPRQDGGSSNESEILGHDSASGTDQQPQVDGNQPVNLDQADLSGEINTDSRPRSSKILQNISLEIRALRDRLLQLEEKAAGELGIEGGPEENENEDGKHTRRDHKGKYWANGISKHRNADSDSDSVHAAWDSDGSMHTKEHPYITKPFGDTAQERRYKEYKGRNQTEEPAPRATEESQKRTEKLAREGEESKMQQHATDSQDWESSYSAARPEGASRPQSLKEEHAKQGFDYVDWRVFRSTKRRPIAESAAIDILVGEPLDDVFDGILTTDDLKEPTGTDTARLTCPEGQAPLPERIKINSIQLIDILSLICGWSGLREVQRGSRNANTSVVMLRPFRILTHFQNEIQEWHAKLVDYLQRTKPASEIVKSVDDAAITREGAKISTVLRTEPADVVADSHDKRNETTFEDRRWRIKSETDLNQLSYLLWFMDRYIYKKVAYLNSPICDKVSFSDIWYLFKPGDFVISANGKQVYQVIKLTFKHQHPRYRTSVKDLEESNESKSDLTVYCTYIHFDGTQLGPVLKVFNFKKFDGEKAVAALEIYPFRFHILKDLDARTVKPTESGVELEDAVEKGVSDLRARLIKRGQLFVKVAAVKHMYYAGLTIDNRDEVESQVMIDFEEAFTRNRHWRPDITHLTGAHSILVNSQGYDRCTDKCCMGHNVYDDSYVDQDRYQRFIHKMTAEIEGNRRKLPSAAIFPRTLEDVETEDNSLKDDEFLIMSHCVFGFVLRGRTWGKLFLYPRAYRGHLCVLYD